MSWKVPVLLAYIAAVTPSFAADLAARVTTFVNNSTPTASNTGPLSSNCCFVVQDNVNAYWWNEYSTAPPFYQVVNVTSVTTFVTPYSNGTVTNYKTHVTKTNASFTSTIQVGYNPASLDINDAPQPFETDVALNGSQIVTASTTLHSPAAFWVYSKLKVITVPAVTNSHGDAVCATTSIAKTTSVETGSGFTVTRTYVPNDGTSAGEDDIFTISGVNSNAEAYFGGYRISGVAGSTIVSPTGYSTESKVLYTISKGDVSTLPATTIALGPESSLFGYSDGKSFAWTGPTTTAAAVLTFPTPFIYFPKRGASGTTGQAGNDLCIQSGGNENYGYVPQTVIDHMAKVPEIIAQYPGIGLCLPGGPSILHDYPCTAPAPSAQSVVGTDLTTGTVITVTGQFDQKTTSSAAPTTTSAAPTTPSAAPTTTSAAPTTPSAAPTTTSAAPTTPSAAPTTTSAEPTTPSAEPTTPSAAPTTTSTDNQSPPSSPSPNSPANSPSPPANPSANPSANPPSSPTTAEQSLPSNGSPSNPTTNVAPSGQSQNTPSAQPANNSPASSNNGGAIASAIASGIGAPQAASNPIPGSVTVIQGSSFAVVGPTTVPANAAVPLSGSTTTINNTPFVILPSGTTAPIIAAGSGTSQVLPGPVSVASGSSFVVLGPTTIPVNSALPISGGSTTVISGTTNVILTASTSISIPSATATNPALQGNTMTLSGGSAGVVIASGTPSASASTSGPIQASAGEIMRVHGSRMALVLGLVVLGGLL